MLIHRGRAPRLPRYNVQMKLADALKTSLDELRMQMLGAQVLLEFQFQSLFQDNSAAVGQSARTLDAAGMMFMVIALGLIAATPANIASLKVVKQRSASIGHRSDTPSWRCCPSPAA
jgi:hypothetical protein